jgi:hypothetical protein
MFVLHVYAQRSVGDEMFRVSLRLELRVIMRVVICMFFVHAHAVWLESG